MWSVEEYCLGEKSKIRLWVVTSHMAQGAKMMVKMEEGELTFWTKKGVVDIRV